MKFDNRIRKFNIIKKKKNINYILKNYNLIIKTEFINIFIKINYLNLSRICILINKKYIKLSVNRNKIKRIIKEFFRKNKYNLNNLDLIFILKKNIKNNINLNIKNIFIKILNLIKLWNI